MKCKTIGCEWHCKGEYCSECFTLMVDQLRTENERLRAALTKINNYVENHTLALVINNYLECYDIGRIKIDDIEELPNKKKELTNE